MGQRSGRRRARRARRKSPEGSRRRRRYARPVQLGILFWFYRDVALCQNRLRLLRRRNPGTPIYGLYGGPRHEASHASALHSARSSTTSGATPATRTNGGSGATATSCWADGSSSAASGLQWDSVFLAQWDLVVVSPLAALLPPMEVGDMLISGVRPVREVESWWQWTRGEPRREYDAFLDHVASRYGPVDDPLCCQFIGLVAPRSFMARYSAIDEPELGFLEYKIPDLRAGLRHPARPRHVLPALVARRARHVAVPRAPRAWSTRWPTPVRLPVMLYESRRPHGRRLFHPYHGIYPHDVASLGDVLAPPARRAADRLADAAVERRLDRVDLGLERQARPPPRAGSAPRDRVERRHRYSAAIRCASATSSAGSTRYSDSQSIRISGLPPTRVATTGMPHARGSITDRDNGSGHRLGTTATSAAWMRARTSRWAGSHDTARSAAELPQFGLVARRVGGIGPERRRPHHHQVASRRCAAATGRRPAPGCRRPSRGRSVPRRARRRRPRRSPSSRRVRRSRRRRCPARNCARSIPVSTTLMRCAARPVPSQRVAVSCGHRQRPGPRGPGRLGATLGTTLGGGRHRWKTTGAPTRAPTRHRVGDVPVAVDVQHVGSKAAPLPHRSCHRPDR